MAATDAGCARWVGGLVLAACALPGVMPTAVRAEEAPEQGVVAFKLSGYAESQREGAGRGTGAGGTPPEEVSGASGGWLSLPGDQRISVITPSLYALVPLGRRWAVEGSLTVDEVSGASPSYYSDISGASHMEDRRTAVDARLTRYFERRSISVGLASSTEQDYRSRALSVEARFASEDQNTTWHVGYGLTRDTLDPYNDIVNNASKRVNEFQVGVTQAISMRDIAQLSYTRSQARGYLNDPYKHLDSRPGQRDADILQLRWNHGLDASSLRLGYRYYRDSYRVQAHTLEAAWVLPLRSGWSVTPSVRYYTQSAASFYADPAQDPAVYPGPVGSPRYFSADQRLSAFGALTLGGKLSWQFAPKWTADAKLELYRQDTGWRLGGQGSAELVPLTALIWQLGVARSF